MTTQGSLSAGMTVESALRDRDRFVAFSFCTSDILIELDVNARINFAAGATAMVAGYGPEKIIGRLITEIVAPADRILIEELIYRMRSYGTQEEGMVRLITARGNSQPLVLSGYFMEELGGRFYMSLRRQPTKNLIIRDDDVDRDDESGLLEANSFVEIASHRLEELNREGEHYQMSTLELEEAEKLRSRLDAKGKAELKAAIGSTLRANSAGGDLAGDLGEDRYAIIHHKDLDVSQLEKRIEAQTQKLDPTGVGIVVHAAHVALGSPGMSDDEATQALIYAIKALEKREGGINMQDLSENLADMVESTARQMAEVRSIIAAETFYTVFQPVVKLRSRSPHHFEALTRFEKDGAGVSPFEFIRLAEDVGLVCDFDLATCRRVLEHLEGKKRLLSDLPVAVNLSGRSLSTTAFMERLDALLEEYSSVRRLLLIEITETVRLKDFSMARNYVSELRHRGHKVCLDDFGAGEMQIDYLKELEVDFVKIDGSYILAAQRDQANRIMLKAITSMCREMKVATIAEMVEQEDLIPFLRECSVMLAQGYLFGRPQPEPKVSGDRDGGLSAAAAAAAEAAKKAASEDVWGSASASKAPAAPPKKKPAAPISRITADGVDQTEVSW